MTSVNRCLPEQKMFFIEVFNRGLNIQKLCVKKSDLALDLYLYVASFDKFNSLSIRDEKDETT